MSTSDIINSILDRPPSTIAPPQKASAVPAKVAFPFRSFRGEELARPRKATNKEKPPRLKPNPILERQRLAPPKKPVQTEAEKKADEKRIALLRASNRGDISLDSVSEIVRKIETTNEGGMRPKCVDPYHSSAPQKIEMKQGRSTTRPPLNPARLAAAPQRPPHPKAGPPNPRIHKQLVTCVVPGARCTVPSISGKRGAQNAPKKAPRQPAKRDVVATRVVGGVPQPKLQPYRPRLPAVGQSTQMYHRAEGRAAQRPARPRMSRSDSDEQSGSDDLADFIDDSIVEEAGSRTVSSAPSAEDWRSQLRSVTGYNPAAYMKYDADEAAESSVSHQAWEEHRSAKIAKREDEEELRAIQAEAAAARSKKRRIE